MTTESLLVLIYVLIGIIYGIYRWNTDIKYIILWRYYCITICILMWPAIIIDEFVDMLVIRNR